MELVEQFFLANDIDDDHKVPTLLSLIGGKTYTLLRDLLAPEKPATKSFQQIVTTLQQHLSPKPLEIAERVRFYKRNQSVRFELRFIHNSVFSPGLLPQKSLRLNRLT